MRRVICFLSERNCKCLYVLILEYRWTYHNAHVNIKCLHVIDDITFHLLNYLTMDVSPSNTISILVCLICSMMMFNTVTCSNVKDRNTLLNFKKGVIDPSGFLASWFPENDCCEWTGVKCDNITGRVTQINLPCDMDDNSHCLTGQFSLSLLELDFLNYLDFSNNQFQGIQYDLQSGNSSNLLFLDLSYNYITIDHIHWLSRFSSLQYLDLSGVYFDKEINWLHSVTMLPSLSELYLEGCDLENVYPSLGYANFSSLQVLSLGYNNFGSELPSWLFNLSCDISHIDLQKSNIHSQLPKTLPNLGSIKSLILSQNYLKGHIPDWFGQLEYLQVLRLSENYFSGPIPESLGNISSLVVLNLYLNELSGNLPESLGGLINLQRLVVDDNYLTGIVSEKNLISLSNLKFFFLRSPALIIDFDPKWVPPFQLHTIELGYVSGQLPSWLFTQSSLKSLMITDSNASFEPLDRFWNFSTQIEFLSLTNNTINGDMSNVLLNSTVTWLTSNNLRGGLPRLSPHVAVLNLANNSLSGPISPLLCHNMKKGSKLRYLEMAYNRLSGELTDCWNDWKYLAHVGLGNNNLIGKIPHSIGSLSNLLALNLNDNKLLGEVPLALKNCQKLLILDLSNNSFSGAIPTWIAQSVRALILRSNHFTGYIPTQICQLNSLMVMDFANNKLSGPIPTCFHNITTLLSDYASAYYVGITIQSENIDQKFDFSLTMFMKGNKYVYGNLMNAIDLSSNNLSRSVPLDMFMLTGLQSLNLSRNQLVGTIPDEIGDMKQLESIDLSYNHFSGKIPQSMSSLHYLGALDLSFNNFVGKIPSGTQLQGFTNVSYMGNHELCGPPLTKVCPQNANPHSTNQMRKEEEEEDESEVYSCFYMGLGIGFAVGYLIVVGVIFFNTRCRHAYFKFLHQLYANVVQKTYSC
ncbi:hypothetical protein RJT34_24933 [Clitoria ternatea]|uniref:Leucine-rich repeat-containing N-terminal plant-type domain-containing protein n=1 Tax=Clitoria ternatea TaxID=43366 RepID=A0AAN9FQW8_CLITE